MFVDVAGDGENVVSYRHRMPRAKEAKKMSLGSLVNFHFFYYLVSGGISV